MGRNDDLMWWKSRDLISISCLYFILCLGCLPIKKKTWGATCTSLVSAIYEFGTFCNNNHSWPKFKIALIKKVGWKSYYCPSFLVIQSKTWMVVVFPLQVFGHVIKNLDGSGFSHPNFLDSCSFYHPTFLTVVFWQVFFWNIAPILNFCQEC